MFIHKLQKIALTTLAFGTVAAPAFAQATTTLLDPYAPGVQLTGPLMPPAQGPMEVPGSGPTPPPEIKGQMGPAPLMPWVPAIPVAPTSPGSTGLSLPLGSASLTPPGVLGPAMAGFIPPPNSAPGPQPPFLNPIGGGINPSQQVTVNASAPLPGTGGYYTTIPKIRKSGQTTQDFGYHGEPSNYGGGGPAQDPVTLLGPLAGWGVPFGIPTGVGYNNGPAGSNNDLYQSSVDLGGGMRMGFGNTVISTGQTIQDYGFNNFTQNSGPLQAAQSTEFGQGLHGSGLNVSKTTDFGFMPGPANPANMNIGVPNGAYGWGPNPPNAIETNF